MLLLQSRFSGKAYTCSLQKSKKYRLDGQVCIKLGDFDLLLFIFKMIDNTKFITNLKIGIVDHLVDKKRLTAPKLIKEGGQHQI